MPLKHLLLLEDNEERIEAFRQIAGELGANWAVQAWRDAVFMIVAGRRQK